MVRRYSEISMSLSVGQLDSARIASFKQGTIKTLAFRRDEFEYVKKDSQLRGLVKQAGVYVLLGSNPDKPKKPIAYVGEGTEIIKRLITHDKDEDKYWTEAAVLVSNTKGGFELGDHKNLEAMLLKKIKQLRKWTVDNANEPSDNRGGLSQGAQKDLEHLLEDAIILFDIIGINVFRDLLDVDRRKLQKDREKNKNKIDQTNSNIGKSNTEHVVKPKNSIETDKNNIFKANGRNFKATMTLYTDQSVILHKNSEISQEIASSNKDKLEKYRNELIKQNKLQFSNGRLILIEDIKFDSSSGAASFVSGSNRSGPMFWKIVDKKSNKEITLKEYLLNGIPTESTPVFYFGKDKFNARMTIDIETKECTVLKNSNANKDYGGSVREGFVSYREKLVTDGILRKEKDYLVFTKDFVFKSPNQATTIVAGYSVNANKSLKLEDGTTYGEWKSARGKKQ